MAVPPQLDYLALPFRERHERRATAQRRSVWDPQGPHPPPRLAAETRLQLVVARWAATIRADIPMATLQIIVGVREVVERDRLAAVLVLREVGERKRLLEHGAGL